MQMHRIGFAVLLLALLLFAFVQGASRASSAEGDSCGVRLASAGIVVERPATLRGAADPSCEIEEPVRLISVANPARAESKVLFPEKPLLACAMAERFARFSIDVAAPLALGIFGRNLDSIATGPGHECRTRNRQPGARTSSHGRGLAVDIQQITLAGGGRVSVAKPAGEADIRFLAALRAAACGTFNTVLGPGADAAHVDHVHIDMEPRGRDGRSKFCQ